MIRMFLFKKNKKVEWVSGAKTVVALAIPFKHTYSYKIKQ